MAIKQEIAKISTLPFGLEAADVLYWDAEFARLIVSSRAEPDIQLEIDPDSGSVRIVDSYLVPLLADRMFFDEHPSAFLVAEGTTNNDVRSYEVANFDNRVTLRDAGPGVRFTADGRTLLTSGTTGAVQIWGVPAITPSPH